MPLSTVPYAGVVEDDPIIMMKTSYILEEIGFLVYEAFDGDEAIGLLEEKWESTVLLFSDVDMPGELNGFRLALHVAEHWPLIEIVIASGHMSPKQGDMPAKATFVTKPFNQRVIHEHAQKILPDENKPAPPPSKRLYNAEASARIAPVSARSLRRDIIKTNYCYKSSFILARKLPNYIISEILYSHP